MYVSEDSNEWGIENAEHLARRVRLFFDHGRLRDLRSIDIEVIGSTVVLSGQVSTFHHKQLATAFALRVAGVGEVANRLEVHDDWKSDKLQRDNVLVRRSRVSE